VGEVLHGIGVSPGFAAGPLYQLARPPPLPAARTISNHDADAEIERVADALVAVAAALRHRADLADKPAVADILRAQAMMADDPVLRDTIADAVRSGMDGAHAIDQAFAAHREAFLAAGGYLAERVADLNDIRDRTVAAFLGQPMPGIPRRAGHYPRRP
jgi:phosphotransferase system enzyme I (PtsI)